MWKSGIEGLARKCAPVFLSRVMSEDESRKRLTKEQREEAKRRVLAGETHRNLAAEFGCTPSYISWLKSEALNPEKHRKKLESQLTCKLTEAELDRLKETLRTSNPCTLGLDPPLREWDSGHVLQLARKWFDKKPSVRILKECLQCVPKQTTYDPLFCRPKPPEKHHISQLSRDLANDEDYVKYYLSPAAERLAWRQYELALADWQKRFGDAEVAYPKNHPESPDPDENMDFPVMQPILHPPAHGQRVGKHAKGKSKPKRKKRKPGRR
jgi:hypothetical protein